MIDVPFNLYQCMILYMIFTFFETYKIQYVPISLLIAEDRVGFWKYYFTVHMNEKFDKLLPERLYNTDLEFRYVL